MQLVVNARTSLHFIFLIEPPAASTSRAGPAYQDLKGRQQRPLKTHSSQDWPIRVQNPKCLRPRGGRRDLFSFYLCPCHSAQFFIMLLVIKLRCYGNR